MRPSSNESAVIILYLMVCGFVQVQARKARKTGTLILISVISPIKKSLQRFFMKKIFNALHVVREKKTDLEIPATGSSNSNGKIHVQPKS